MTVLKLFEVVQREDGSWVPVDLPYKNQFAFYNDGVSEPRKALFDAVNSLYPDIYYYDKTLTDLQREWFAKVNKKTDELIAAGFYFDGYTYNISLGTQIKFLSLLQVASLVSYPMYFNSLDDFHETVINDSEHLLEFINEGLHRVNYALSSGTLLKQEIRNATDVSFFDTFTDNRV